MNDAPKRIFLQVDPDGERPECVDASLEGVTWCVDQINDNDVAYIRVDLVEAIIRDA